MAAAPPGGSSIKQLVSEIKKHKNFKRLAAWAADALADAAAPPASGWERKIKSAARNGAIPSLTHILRKFGDDSNLARQCIRLIDAACTTGVARESMASATDAVASHVLSFSSPDGPVLDDDGSAAMSPAAAILRAYLAEQPAGDLAAPVARACMAILVPRDEHSEFEQSAREIALDGLRLCAEAGNDSRAVVVAALREGDGAWIAWLGSPTDEGDQEIPLDQRVTAAAAALLRHIASTADGCEKLKTDSELVRILLDRIDDSDLEHTTAQVSFAEVLRVITLENLEEQAEAANTDDEDAGLAALDLQSLRNIGAAALSGGWSDTLASRPEFLARIVQLVSGDTGAADEEEGADLQAAAIIAVGRIAASAGPRLRSALARAGALDAVYAIACPPEDDDEAGHPAQHWAFEALGRLLSIPQGITQLGMAQVRAARERDSEVEVRDVQVSMFRSMLPLWAAQDASSLRAAAMIVTSAQAGLLDDDVLAEAGLLEFVEEALGADGAGNQLPAVESAKLLAAASAVIGVATPEQAAALRASSAPEVAIRLLRDVSDAESAGPNSKGKAKTKGKGKGKGKSLEGPAADSDAAAGAAGTAAATKNNPAMATAVATACMAFLAALAVSVPPSERVGAEAALGAALLAFRSVRQTDTSRQMFAQLAQASIEKSSIPSRIAAVTVLVRSLRASQGDEDLFRDADGFVAELGIDTKNPPGSSPQDAELAAPILSGVDMGSPKAVGAVLLQQLSVLEATVALPGFYGVALAPGSGASAMLAVASLSLLRLDELATGQDSKADSRTRMGASAEVIQEAAVRVVRVVDKLLRVGGPAVSEARVAAAAAAGGAEAAKTEAAPARRRSKMQLSKLLRSAASMVIMTRSLQKSVQQQNRQRLEVRGAMEREAAAEHEAGASAARGDTELGNQDAGAAGRMDRREAAAAAAAAKRIDAVVQELARRMRSTAAADDSEVPDAAEVDLLRLASRSVVATVLGVPLDATMEGALAMAAARGRAGTVGTGKSGATSADREAAEDALAEQREHAIEAGTSVATLRWGADLVAASAELLVDCAATARNFPLEDGTVSLAVEARLLTALLLGGHPPVESYRYVSACLGIMTTDRGLNALEETDKKTLQATAKSVCSLTSGLAVAATRPVGRSEDAVLALANVGFFLHAAAKQMPDFAEAVRADGAIVELLEAAGQLASFATAQRTANSSSASSMASVATARSALRRAVSASLPEDAVDRWSGQLLGRLEDVLKVERAASASTGASTEATSGPSAAVDMGIIAAQSSCYKLSILMLAFRGVPGEVPGTSEQWGAIEEALAPHHGSESDREGEADDDGAAVGQLGELYASIGTQREELRAQAEAAKARARAAYGVTSGPKVDAPSLQSQVAKGMSSLGSFRVASKTGDMVVSHEVAGGGGSDQGERSGNAMALAAAGAAVDQAEPSIDLTPVEEEDEDEDDHEVEAEPVDEAAAASAATRSMVRVDTFIKSTLGSDFEAVDDVDVSDDENEDDAAAATAYDVNFQEGGGSAAAVQGDSSEAARMKKVNTLVPHREGAKRKDTIGCRAERLRDTQRKIERIEKQRERKLEDAAGVEFYWHSYAQLRTPESFVRHMFMGASKAKELQYRWQATDIVRSMMYFKDRDVEANAKRTFACLLRYAGEIPPDEASPRSSYAMEIMRIGLAFPVLTNEIYLQILKQLTMNESPLSRARYWSLLSMISGTYPPGADLLPYVYHWLGGAIKAGGAAALHALFCLRLLDLVGDSGPTGYVPGEAEIASYDARLPIMVNVQLPAGDHLLVDIPVAPDLTVEQLAQICEQTAELDADEASGLSLYIETLPAGADVILCPDSASGLMPMPVEAEARQLLDPSGYVGDELAQSVRGNAPFRVVYGRWLPVDLSVDDIRNDGLLHILFCEGVLQLCRGGVPESCEKRSVELAALAMAVEYGKDLMTDATSVERLGVQQYISPPARSTKSAAEWAALVSAVLAGEHDPRNKPLAAIRAAFLTRYQEHMFSGTAQINVQSVAPENLVFGKVLPEKVRFGVGLGGLVLLDCADSTVAAGFDLPDIEKWSATEEHLLLQVAVDEEEGGKIQMTRRMLKFQSKQAREALDYLIKYVDLSIRLRPGTVAKEV